MKNQNKKIGNFYFTDGLDMQCKPTIEKVQLIRLLDDNEHRDYNEQGVADCVVRCSDGILCMHTLSELRDCN